MFEARKTSIGLTIAAIALQVAATIYFLIDALGESGSGGIGLFEMLVAVALLAGIAYGALTVRRLLAEADRRERALALARGALSELIRQRFAQWSLSRAEAEVALFALKGCSIAEIAHLRGAASGTVRSQLSQVYAKAGVNGQPMLMSLFLDDLLDPDALATG
ncbi:MAG: response regulator transcription factor [Sphingomonadales bacterium]|nr:response regulator transcription factor [Sphingomonadales bacterium]MBD3774304.1 response regulator transcription factor [Paracoccaceae bacterium]